ncbi:MAG: bifunctional UDP-N-acetylmuramoyl-tripeptide:D-alanyl-D-alanine ligase/alanine racemase [Ferruginibacter sp.]
MSSILFSEIADVLQVKPLQQCSNPSIARLLTDSRKMLIPDSTLFFAINTAKRNANVFIKELYDKNLRNFIIQSVDDIELSLFAEANIILVPDVLGSLQQIAAHHRHKFQFPVIGITGSNGKTIVKEWLYQLLSNEFNIIRSPRSYNSQVGVPLSIWQMSEAYNLAIIEAGISTIKEMSRLQKIIDPDFGLITFIGDAHAEGFESVSQKINEKLALFTQAKMLIYSNDDGLLQEGVRQFVKTQNPGMQLFTWGFKPGADLTILQTERGQNGTLLTASWKNESFKFFIPFTDKASVNNAISCCCVLLKLDIPADKIFEKMRQLRPVEMRLELKEGISNCSIINDSYSVDINSLSIALDFLSQHPRHKKHTVILSDLFQAGQPANQLYKTIAEVLARKKLFRFIGIGNQLSLHQQLFSGIEQMHFFNTTEELISAIPALQFRDETILLKGARTFEFEKISQLLEQKNHETILEINLNALRHNFLTYKKLLAPGTKLMAMVKAFSYGSGSFQVASLLQHEGADYLAVAYADEGIELRRAGIHLPIMVMNTEAKAFESIIANNLQPELYSFNILKAFKDYLLTQGISHYPVHIKLDTGMHRLGFEKDDIEKLCELISVDISLHIVSVFSHLVASDDISQDDFTNHQWKLFVSMSDGIKKVTGHKFLRHIANTSAIHRHKEMQMDMVRLGIGLYGINPDAAMQKKLQNVTTLKTTVSQVKKVKKGDSVGYGRKAILEKDSIIATVRIGYADGYPRTLGNGKGKMFINGSLAPVIGNVCMDMTMIDITGIAAGEEDEVTVFGEVLPVSELASWASTIPYEILTNISQRVKRVYYEE